MDVLDVSSPSRPPLTGGNATELGIGSSRRQSGVVIRETANLPRQQARDVNREGDGDPMKLGFDRIMSRFDQLEMRMDNSDRRMDKNDRRMDDFLGLPVQEEEFSNEEYDSDDREYRAHRVDNLQTRGYNPRHHVGSRGGRPPRGGRGDMQRGRDYYRREEGVPCGTRQRRATSWDLPQQHQRGGTRRPTAWDSPRQREQAIFRQGGDDNPGVSMRAPYFDGSNATNWISRVEYYFNHKQTPEGDRLHYTVMLFEPPAAEWIFNYQKNNPYVTWPEFLEDVRHRFDPQSFKNYTGPLAKLVQTGSVAEYHNTFERYLDRVQGLSDESLIPIFIEGLKQPLQETVELQQPKSLAEAMALALRLGASQERRAQQATSLQKRQWPTRDSRLTAGPPSSSYTPSQTGGPAVNSKIAPIRVSQAEKSERSRKGLCWHCPEKYTPGHVCAVKLLCYVGEEDDDEDTGQENECQVQDDHVITADLSHLHSLNGNSKSSPFRVTGNIGSTEVGVLIDTGSTHDFLHPRIAESLQLSLTPIRPFRVYVGNGASLLCSHVSRRTKLIMQGVQFLVDLHILEVHGADVILGMDWLESLGKISADFVGKTLEFKQGETSYVLKGDGPSPQQLSLHSLMLLAAYSPSHEFYEIVPLEPDQGIGDGPTTETSFPPDLPPQVTKVLEAHNQVFSLPVGMPPQRAFDHKIHLLPNTKPINVRPYRYPYFQKNEIERQVKEMLEQGIIQRSQSPFSSPVLLIRKKDGSFRFCIDYRALNLATVPDHFPIPTADELFDELGAAKFFTKLDLRSGYHQIRMHGEDIFKTAFRTHDGHFEFLVMPFGLTNAPSTFQAAMNSIFQPLLRKFVIVFFDDILVYSPSLETHCEHLTEVLSLLQSHQFFVKLTKCSFCSTTVEYLGHLITDGLLKADPAKLEAMTAWPRPRTVKQLRGFLGLTGYYRRFVQHYAVIAAPLTDLLKKDCFEWTASAADAFDNLKAAMTSAPVLSLPDFSKHFCIETDASDVGIGAVLIQDAHPIAFFSRKLGPRRRAASTYHKELFAIVEAVQKWRQYLLGREFVIRSDQKSLKELLQQVVQTPDQQMYVRKLMGYKFRIEYKKGISNKAADALSRRDESASASPGGTDAALDEASADGALLTAVAHPIPRLLDVLRSETATLPDLVELTDKIRAGEAPAHLTWVDGLIYYDRRVFVSPASTMKKLLLEEHHCTPSAGHPGHERTFRLLAAGFYWTKMRKEVRDFVDACAICQSTKYSTQKPAGLLQPLPVPSQVWDDVSMDFITGLPQSRGYTTIMVVVDRLSKYAHFAALPTRFDALRVAHLFVNTVVRHHGFPKTLVSDRDSVFLNAVWEETLRLSGTKLNFSTAYHPQTDGQTEIRNKGLEQYLRAFTADRPSTWSNFLPWAELALNCFHHAGLGTSPFRALYGREPPSLVAAPPSAKTPPNVAELIRERGALLVELRRNLQRAQQRMSASANKHRRHIEFEVGDFVWLKLQPYRQYSVAKPVSAKLAKRFYGPFEILQKIGPVAYKLRLPEGSRVHNVFHVSLLRAFVSTNEVVPLPAKFSGVRPIAHPVAILESQIMWHDGKAVEHVLVRWSDGTDSPSWEPLSEIRRRFPDLPLEDKGAAKEGGVVTNAPTPSTNEVARETAAEQVTKSPAEDEDRTEAAEQVTAAEQERTEAAEQVTAAEQERTEVPSRSLRPRDRLKPPNRLLC